MREIIIHSENRQLLVPSKAVKDQLHRLGHADTKTTLGCIGVLNAEARKPPAIYSFDVSRLAAL